MPQVKLNGAGIAPVIGELETGAVPQHVRMNRERQTGLPPGSRHDLPEGGIGEGTFAFGDERVRCLWIKPCDFPQGADLRRVQGVGAGGTVLSPTHVQQALLEVDLVPAEADKFAHSQPVPVGDEDHGAVPLPMPAGFPRRIANELDLGLGEVLAGTKLCVRSFTWWGGRHTAPTFPKTVFGAPHLPKRKVHRYRVACCELSRKESLTGKSALGCEVEALVHVEFERAVGIHVSVHQRTQRPEVLRHHPLQPLLLHQHLLQHQGVGVNEGHLQQVKAQDRYLLVIEPVGGNFAALAVEDEAVGAVPGFNDLQRLRQVNSGEAMWSYVSLTEVGLPQAF